MSEPRGVEERIDWMLDHPPGEPGWCARETWQALGGDQSPPNPPAWGCSDANECYDKVVASGRYWTTTPIPRGAAIYWKYGSNGHAALSAGGGEIVTTDPNGNPGGVGIEDLDYPERWGASGTHRIWTDQYAGVRFPVEGIDHGDVFLSKLVYGQLDSDSVKRLQAHLNEHSLTGGSTLPVTGNLLDQTAAEVKLDRQQHGFAENVGDEFVSEAQVRHLIPFGSCGCELINDTVVTPPDPEPEEPELASGYNVHRWYSGKKTNEVTVKPGGWHLIDLPTMPPSGKSGKEEHFLYLRILLPASRSATRTIETYWERSDGDETAYWGPAWDAGAKDSIPYYNFHTEDGTGLGGRWWIKVTGGSDPIKYSTRYAKTTVEYSDPIETLAAVSTSAMQAGALLGERLIRWLANKAA